MKCSCNNEPAIKKGLPAKDGDKVYWTQIYICNNPNCSCYTKEIGVRLVNIFDESEIIEKSYVSS